ncbi:MAG: cell wall-binding repeat-containing protein, partial [Coriobacteriales bacterium]
TAAYEASAAYDAGAKSGTAVLVGGEGDAWADALSASSLAGAMRAPILITEKDSLSSSASSVISSKGISNVIVIGGTGAVSSDVVESLESLGCSVERISGSDRYDTQAAIYEYGKDNGYWTSKMVIFATGENFADSLSISSLAYTRSLPIFLVDEDGSFTDAQMDCLEESGMGYAIVLGGTGVIPDSTYYELREMTRSASGSGGTTHGVRLSGANRYETSVEIAEWATDQGYLKWDGAAFASGTVPYDSLAGCALQGRSGSVMLLVNSSSNATVEAAGTYASSITSTIKFFGGYGAVDASTRLAVLSNLSWDSSDPTYECYGDYAIMGSSNTTVSDMVALYNSTGKEYPSSVYKKYGASTITEFCEILYEEAEAEGVNAEVVFCQAMIETGWLQFGGDVEASQCNFCGLGATGNGVSGADFGTEYGSEGVQMGLRAQVQHLKAYASYEDLNQDLVDPRFSYVTRGKSPTVRGLSGTWAASTSYGNSIFNLINTLVD